EGELTAAGELLIEVDEGHIGAIEIRGLEAGFAREVKRELALERGDVFSSGELYTALDRVQRKWPFVRADRRKRRANPAPILRIEERDGAVKFHSEQPSAGKARPPPPPDADDDEDGDGDEPAGFEMNID